MLKLPAVSQEALRRIGGVVRRERVRRGYSQERFAELAGVHRNYIGMLERAEVNASFALLHAVAKACRLSLRELCRRARV